MVFCHPFAYGRVIRVGNDAQADFDNVQAGIDAAVPGDTVLAAAGQYVVTVPISFRGKAITVRSEAGPEVTTIRMSRPANLDRASVVIFENGETETAVLDGFTISGGQGCPWEHPLYPGTFYQVGGGVFCRASSPTITGCVISDNHTLLRNQAQDIGGGVTLANSSAVLTHCTIRNNSTTYWAGGIYVFNGSPKLIDCIIRQNSVLHQNGQGGGMIADSDGSASSKPTLLRCTISANSARHAAGGIQVTTDSQCTFVDCVIADNTCGAIGGICCSYSSVTTLQNCRITGNSADRKCGGVGCGHHGEAILLNCTITGNVAGVHSGGIMSYDNSFVTVQNCIVFGNTAPSGPEVGLDYQDYHTPATIHVSYSDVRGGVSATYVEQGCTLQWGAGNIDADPLFADPGNGDLHLKSQAGRWKPNSGKWVTDDVTSPGIDAGDPNSPVAFEPFPNGGVINLGAYGGTAEASKSSSSRHSTYGGGTGEPNNPYLIFTAEQMNAIGAEPNDWDKHFKLMVDIDLSGLDGKDGRLAFNMIAPAHTIGFGLFGTPFAGVFDGNGHAVSHLTLSFMGYGSHVGLFGYLGSGGEVRNLGVVDVNVTSPSFRLGELSPYSCSTGGLVGLNEGAVTHCYSTGTVNGDFAVGGLVGMVGRNTNGTVTQCYSTGTVSGSECVGGLVGYNYFPGSTLIQCYSTSTVSGNECVGGLVGQNEGGGSATQCYSTGAVSGHARVGGLVGCNVSGNVIQCYSTGVVDGNDSVGGLVGYNDSWLPGSGTVTQCYSTGAVRGNSDVGGLVGANTSGAVTQCFWDTQTSGQTTSDGGTGKTTAEMQTAKTFLDAGWDFVGETKNGTEDIWCILDGAYYPLLWDFAPSHAWSPYPEDGAIDIGRGAVLAWVPGHSGGECDVYFGQDANAVGGATVKDFGIYRGRQRSARYDLAGLE
jgi:hypothetical protein